MIQPYNRTFKENEKWSGDVKTKWHPGEGIFSKSGEEIAKEAKSGHGGDIGSSIKSLQFHINRAGKNMPKDQKANVEAAIHKLQAENKKAEAYKRNFKENVEKAREYIRTKHPELEHAFDQDSEDILDSYVNDPSELRSGLDRWARWEKQHGNSAEMDESVRKLRIREHFMEPEFLDYEDRPSEEFYGSNADEEEERELARRHFNRHRGVPTEPEFAERYKSPYKKKLKEDEDPNEQFEIQIPCTQPAVVNVFEGEYDVNPDETTPQIQRLLEMMLGDYGIGVHVDAEGNITAHVINGIGDPVHKLA